MPEHAVLAGKIHLWFKRDTIYRATATSMNGFKDGGNMWSSVNAYESWDRARRTEDRNREQMINDGKLSKKFYKLKPAPGASSAGAASTSAD